MVQMTASFVSKETLYFTHKRSRYQMDIDHSSLRGPQSRIAASSAFLRHLCASCDTSACFGCLVYMLCLFGGIVSPALAQRHGETNGSHGARQTAETVLSLNAAAIVQALRQGSSNSLNQTGQQVVGRNLNIQPTITVRVVGAGCQHRWPAFLPSFRRLGFCKHMVAAALAANAAGPQAEATGVGVLGRIPDHLRRKGIDELVESHNLLIFPQARGTSVTLAGALGKVTRVGEASKAPRLQT
jgi:hypothetical protein